MNYWIIRHIDTDGRSLADALELLGITEVHWVSRRNGVVMTLESQGHLHLGVWIIDNH